MMTNQEKIELSKAVADKYGIEVFMLYPSFDEMIDAEHYWLVADWNRIMPLAVEHKIGFSEDLNGETIIASYMSIFPELRVTVREDFADHPNKDEAVRIAICKALLEKE